MKERWTEQDVMTLPHGEHDYFERKAGQIVKDPAFRDKLAKALSAFANSGGGHIIFGVRDDGTFDGVEPTVGRTSMRDLIEQIVPILVDFSLSAFRVHEVEPSTPSSIPPGRVLIVVDVGDSPHAPHQARCDKVYYYRPGGRSERAPHFYLEALRNRAIRPVLSATPTGVSTIDAYEVDGRIVIGVTVSFQVKNVGRTVARYYLIDFQYRGPSQVADSVFCNLSDLGPIPELNNCPLPA